MVIFGAVQQQDTVMTKVPLTRFLCFGDLEQSQQAAVAAVKVMQQQQPSPPGHVKVVPTLRQQPHACRQALAAVTSSQSHSHSKPRQASSCSHKEGVGSKCTGQPPAAGRQPLPERCSPFAKGHTASMGRPSSLAFTTLGSQHGQAQVLGVHHAGRRGRQLLPRAVHPG